MARNPRSLPFVRVYEQAISVDDPTVAPLLATSLAYRNVGVITRRQPEDRLPEGMPTATVGRDQGCDRPTLVELGAAAGEVATACALDPWLSALLAGVELVRADESPGAVFTARADGLRGISVYLDQEPNRAEVSLYEVGDDGQTLGPELAVAQSVGIDENGLAAFPFDPIVQSAGRRYTFAMSCGSCPSAEVPRMVAGVASGGKGDFTVGGERRVDRLAAFTPIHDEIPPATPPQASITAESPGAGSWRVTTEGPNPALLVVAETWFPGWTAKVDGKRVPVLQADGAFLGVAVGAGSHTVELDYKRPTAAVIGRIITVGVILALVVGYWRQPRGPDADPDTEHADPDEEWDEELDSDEEWDGERVASPPPPPPRPSLWAELETSVRRRLGRPRRPPRV